MNAVDKVAGDRERIAGPLAPGSQDGDARSAAEGFEQIVSQYESQPDNGGMRRVTLATGVELAVHEFGDGEPVLLLHAWGETHRSFDRLVPLLPRSLHLVVPDQRGVGESAKPADGYALCDAVDDVVALLDALGLDPCWLVGTSSGGYLAQQIAVDHPERVRGLVLVGAPSNLQQPLPVSFVDVLGSFHDPVTRDDVNALNGALPLHTPVPDTRSLTTR